MGPIIISSSKPAKTMVETKTYLCGLHRRGVTEALLKISGKQLPELSFPHVRSRGKSIGKVNEALLEVSQPTRIRVVELFGELLTDAIAVFLNDRDCLIVAKHIGGNGLKSNYAKSFAANK
ncbi:hypothetical protein AVEN_55208-1 [Araneus ventricosus]|uniref:Uncharacterized protein n=1 Tax=Araneus ventricosus TaxID=182803 RepID=A0A4Y2G6X3_ARAVE|nr:hypothetical protein AVEN_55208-1 [Araneus ventricosus]